ncbi:hypothetical protein OESDEN_04485 [Oesophagostomum dentatum]|uniref:Acyltransferase 3 domain-containing protein n=1 Tax=Oesophagostomum dentatum TaxID=61180 RepID=A0A0B1TE77_OESDE|nr:hypothetical protein OESDEN_04485 [Oesophagostomum dentatum]
MYTNASTLMSVAPPKDGTLKSLASVRFISMTWIAAGHVLLQEVNSGTFQYNTTLQCTLVYDFPFTDVLKPVLNMRNPLLSTTVTNAFLAVDTFFVLSGILVSYLFFKGKPTKRLVKNWLTWVMYYVHRYIRLTPPVMAFIGFLVTFDPLINGPWSKSMVIESLNQNFTLCKDYWWRNILYINNFFKSSEGCYTITWYLAVDTQLYVVAPIFLITLFISTFAGLAVILVGIVASVGYVYAITLHYSYPAIIIGGNLNFAKIDEFFDKYYDKPWTRCPPYLIGIAVGYCLALGRKPKMNKGVIAALWIAATAIALASLYGPHRYIKGAEIWRCVFSIIVILNYFAFDTLVLIMQGITA